MADTRYLKQRRQGWYSNIPIPFDLREYFNNADHVVRTLATRDLTVAQRKRWKALTDAHAEFDRMRRVDQKDNPSPEDIEERAWETYHDTLKDAEERKADQEEIDTTISVLGDQIESGKLTELEEAETWAIISAMYGRQAYLRGQPYKPPPVFGRRGIDPIALRPVYRRGSSKVNSMAFSEAAQRYLQEIQRDENAKLTEQTVGQSGAVYRLFKDFIKDAPLTDIPRAQASKFLATIATLDPHWGRSPKTKERSLEEILGLYGGHEKGLSNRTVNRYAISLGAVFKWARKRGHHIDGENPFEGQMLKEASTRKTGWVPYTMDELSTLLSSLTPQVTPTKHTNDTALAWAAWVAAYSGMRLNEICSLGAGDIQLEDGVWFFDVTDAKTEAGIRRVPVHSRLMEVGLLDYRKRIDEGPMWPALKPGGPDKKLSWYATKRFTKVRRGLGLTRDRLGFHSLRKNVGTALERARVPESEAVEIMGHEKISESYETYSLGLELKALQEIVEKITYPDI